MRHDPLHLLPWLALAARLAGYWTAARRLWRRQRRWSGWRCASFTAGVLLLGLGLAPPVAELAHHDFRGHMAQHLLLGMAAPLGLVFAAPVTLALRALPVAAARRLAALPRAPLLRALAHPVTALVLNIGGMYLLYLTPLYLLSLTSASVHVLVHWHFIAAGCLYAWSIAGPDAAPRRASMRLRLVVLFLGMGLHAALAKIMYGYGWPRGTPHALAEIRAGAELMYYGGDLAELVLVVALFVAWYRARRGYTVGNATRTARPPRVSLGTNSSVPL